MSFFQIDKFLFHRFLPAYRKILHSGLFDQQYYQTLNQDVTDSGIEPLAHYVSAGFKEKRWPHPLFDPEYYVSQLSDASSKRINPLLHYIQEGEECGFEPHPLFSPKYYREQCQKKGLKVHGNLLAHYMKTGGLKEVDPHPLFHSKYFTARVLDAFKVTTKEPLIDYLSVPDYFNISPHPLFDINYYIDQVTDDKAFTMPLIIHYRLHGYKQGLEPHPLFDSRSYGAQKGISANDDSEPLSHYLLEGRKTGLNPLPFNAYKGQENNELKSDSFTFTRNDVCEYIRSIGLEPEEKAAILEQQLYKDNVMSKKFENAKGHEREFSLFQYMQKRIEKICGDGSW